MLKALDSNVTRAHHLDSGAAHAAVESGSAVQAHRASCPQCMAEDAARAKAEQEARAKRVA